MGHGSVDGALCGPGSSVSKVLPCTQQLALSSPDADAHPFTSLSQGTPAPAWPSGPLVPGSGCYIIHPGSLEEPDGLASRAPSCQQEARRAGCSVGQDGSSHEAMARHSPLAQNSSLCPGLEMYPPERVQKKPFWAYKLH